MGGDLLHDEDAEHTEDGPDSSTPASYATYEEYEAAMADARAAEPYEIDYMSDLSLAPGWKVGGYASWHPTDPAPVDRPRCATPMPPLLTVDTWECDGAHGAGSPSKTTPTTPGSSIPSGSTSAAVGCASTPARPTRPTLTASPSSEPVRAPGRQRCLTPTPRRRYSIIARRRLRRHSC
ncbi:hypothetical protein ABZ557_18515 [Streptomyces sp. NPDC019645]|uniref:hypothetical protein n=1 Tax=Streptomyces sp. NPDC019645 TaxID=3154786 RepID=UPI0033C3BE82